MAGLTPGDGDEDGDEHGDEDDDEDDDDKGVGGDDGSHFTVTYRSAWLPVSRTASSAK